jgi:hypothetical protein
MAVAGGCRRRINGCTDPAASNYDFTANTDDGSCNLVLTQAQYNQIGTLVRGGVTGVQFGGPATVPHVLTDLTLTDANQTIRDVYSNRSSLQGALPVGTVVVKRIFLKNQDGSRGSASNVYAMVKQPAGYYPSGGDWQYIAIKYDPAIINATTPNGIIASAAFNGKVQLCAGCHAAAPGNRFVFTPN